MSREKMIGLAEAAALLRLPYQDTHRLMLLGKMRGEKRGGRWYVFRKDVDHLRDARRTDESAPTAKG